MNKFYKLISLLAILALLIGCGDDNDLINDSKDITGYFDAKFAARLQAKGYVPDAEKIQYSQVKGIEILDIGGGYGDRAELPSLAGIEYFQALTHLACHQNYLTTIDISKNTALTYLFCPDNKFTTLDVSKNTKLESLICSNNPLTTLDVTKNTKLVDLNCYNNTLTTLDVSKNTKLNALYCSGNLLTTLDVSKNTNLIELGCNNNKLTSLDISENTKLNSLHCYKNPGVAGKFIVKSWFDNSNIPTQDSSLPLYIDFTKGSWELNSETVTIEYQKQ